MNYFEYQYGQTSDIPKFNYEKHEICLIPKIPCVCYNGQQLLQALNVPRPLMTNMNNFEHQFGQRSNMPKFNYEKHEICLLPKMLCVSHNEQHLFRASSVPRSLMTNMNNFEYQLCQV